MDSRVEDDYIVFTFEDEISETDKLCLCRSVPKDFGYKFKDVQHNLKCDYNEARIFLPFIELR